MNVRPYPLGRSRTAPKLLALLLLLGCAALSVLPALRIHSHNAADIRTARVEFARVIIRTLLELPGADLAAAADALVTSDRNGISRELFTAIAGGLRGRHGALRAVSLFNVDPQTQIDDRDALMFSETIPGFDDGGRRLYLPVRYRIAATQGRPLLAASSAKAASLPLYRALSKPAVVAFSKLYTENDGSGTTFWIMRAVTAPDGKIVAVLGAEINADALIRGRSMPDRSAVLLSNADDPKRGIIAGAASARNPIDSFAVGNDESPLRASVMLDDTAAADAGDMLPTYLVAGVSALAALFAVALLSRQNASQPTDFLDPTLDHVGDHSVRSTESSFRKLLETADMIPWNADLSNYSFTYIGPQITIYTEYPPSAWTAPGFWLSHVHPDDRKLLTLAAAELATGAERVMREYRVRRADGSYLKMRGTFLRASPEQTEDGLPRRLYGFMTDITEQERAQKSIHAAREAAEHANRTKSEFLATMSHELRTPLNAIIGFSEIMREEILGSLGNDKYREYVRNIHASGRHLLELINDVLDLSKIEAGHLELHEEEIQMHDLIGACRTLVAERAQRSGVKLHTQMPEPDVTLYADGRRLKQVLINLLSNAVKFTESGGNVTLAAQMHPSGNVHLTVSDTGVGMKPEQLATALEKFRQVDGGSTRAHEGTGLGLPIARSLAELHGGTLTLESVYGSGTTVTVMLPASRVRMLQPLAESKIA